MKTVQRLHTIVSVGGLNQVRQMGKSVQFGCIVLKQSSCGSKGGFPSLKPDPVPLELLAGHPK